MIIHIFGLSGSGKTTISKTLKQKLQELNFKVEVLDGDDFRRTISRDLSFSKADRIANIERMFEVAKILERNDIITIISAISPYNQPRAKYKLENAEILLIWLKCDLEILQQRDTKGLYKRAMLDDSDENKITNLTGVNDAFETSGNEDIIIDTGILTVKEACDNILKKLNI